MGIVSILHFNVTPYMVIMGTESGPVLTRDTEDGILIQTFQYTEWVPTRVQNISDSREEPDLFQLFESLGNQDSI